MIEVLKIMHNLCDIESTPKLLKWDNASFRMTGNGGHIKYYAKMIYSKIKYKYKKQCFSSHSD